MAAGQLHYTRRHLLWPRHFLRLIFHPLSLVSLRSARLRAQDLPRWPRVSLQCLTPLTLFSPIESETCACAGVSLSPQRDNESDVVTLESFKSGAFPRQLLSLLCLMRWADGPSWLATLLLNNSLIINSKFFQPLSFFQQRSILVYLKLRFFPLLCPYLLGSLWEFAVILPGLAHPSAVYGRSCPVCCPLSDCYSTAIQEPLPYTFSNPAPYHPWDVTLRYL